MAKTILISIANPVGTSNISPDSELRDIKNIVKQATHSDNFILKTTIATRLSDLQKALEKHQPQVVHFGGHGKGEKGLVLEDDNRRPYILTNKELLALFTPLATEIECVFLNACHSLEQAQVIRQQIGCVIGMRNKVADKTANKLAEVFYQRLGAGEGYPAAFAKAYKAIAKMTDANVPVLLQQAELPPSFIVEPFKNKRVALFIGPQCAESAGFPSQAALQEKMLNKLRPKVKKEDEKRLKSWLKQVDGYKRIAQLFKTQFTNDYRDFMQENFNPDQRSKAYQPPSYFAYLGNLPLKYIVTTNLDKLLEDSLPSHWEGLTWQDKEDFPRILRHDRPLLLHLLGRADRFGTVVYALSDYKRLEGEEGSAARDFLLDIFKTTTVLLVGYELNDPILAWLKKFVFSKSFEPEWHILLSNPTIEQQQRAVKQQIKILPCSQVDEWFTALAKMLNVSQQTKVVPESEESEPGWTQISQSFLEQLPPVSHTVAQRYYQGHSVSWPLIKAGYTVRRAVVAKVLAKLPDEGLGAFLLTAAGGEGKSTVLMQLALELADQGYNTFHCAEPEPREVLAWFRKQSRNGKLAVLIDNADLLPNLKQILRQVENKRYDVTCIILAARGNEWRNVYRTNPQDLQSFPVGRLTKTEARGIAQKLLACQLATDVSAMTERLLAKKNQFLLAAMLMATHGESLPNILASVIGNIAEWPDGEELLEALGCVVALESRQNKKGQYYFCSQRLFQEFLGGISKAEMRRLCNRLTGEVSLKPHGGYRIETRHPVIAETLFKVLFAEENGFLDEIDIHERILQVAGRFSREEVNPSERKLLTILPLVYVAQSDYEKARALFKAATEAESRHAPTWQAWALLEEKQGNIGEVEQQYSARWLFKQGTVVEPRDAPTWQAWALLEEKQGNLGEVEQQYSARWLFKQGTVAESNNVEAWKLWALLEEKQGNIGEVEQEYSARWLFKQGTVANSNNAQVWTEWALLEEKQGNIGEVEQQYSARWLFKQGTVADSKHAPTWQAWALLEEKQGNIGEVEQQYSARWLFKQGTVVEPRDAPTWQAWALLEEKQGNIGEVEQQYSARWLFKQGSLADSKHAPVWQAWALLEEKQGNLDKAKQIAQQGLQYCPNNSAILDVLKKIKKQPNPEDDITTLINQGKCDQAAQRLQLALFKNPQDETALKLRQMWEEKCGKPEDE
jgi:Flp pilus assembly protein TadD/Mrp family chromosome partitioning ATPase